MSYFAPNIPQEKHCFFGNKGGVSTGKYASLNTNLSSQDNQENIRQNFALITQYFHLQPSQMVTLRQSISNIAVLVHEPSWFTIKADGAVTTNPKLLLGVKTADCAPILLADYQHGVIGVAHAGWRGAVNGIIHSVVDLMCQQGAHKKDIVAAIGPCLQQSSFAVKNDMRQAFLQASPQYETYFLPDNDGEHFYFDLSGFVFHQLRLAEIENITNAGIDTYPPQNGYFSYRRNTHTGLITTPFDYPTQYSCIKL